MCSICWVSLVALLSGTGIQDSTFGESSQSSKRDSDGGSHSGRAEYPKTQQEGFTTESRAPTTTILTVPFCRKWFLFCGSR